MKFWMKLLECIVPVLKIDIDLRLHWFILL